MIDALFSDKLWTGNGMLTQSGDKTYWDRSALYAFRGIFRVGAAEVKKIAVSVLALWQPISVFVTDSQIRVEIGG